MAAQCHAPEFAPRAKSAGTPKRAHFSQPSPCGRIRRSSSEPRRISSVTGSRRSKLRRQQFISRGSGLDSELNSGDPDVRRMAQGFRDALYDAANGGGQGTQGAVDAWRAARYCYKVLSTVGPQITRTVDGTAGMSNAGLAHDIGREFNMTPSVNPNVPASGPDSDAMSQLAWLL